MPTEAEMAKKPETVDGIRPFSTHYVYWNDVTIEVDGESLVYCLPWLAPTGWPADADDDEDESGEKEAAAHDAVVECVGGSPKDPKRRLFRELIDFDFTELPKIGKNSVKKLARGFIFN